MTTGLRGEVPDPRAGIPLALSLAATNNRAVSGGNEPMETIRRCVIWGEGPESRDCLGAGIPMTPADSLQGTAAR